MKTKLTPEQSQRLIELGVDPRMATVRRVVYKPYDVTDRQFPQGISIFKLDDILSLLPKEIYSEERDITYCLTIEMRPFGSSVRYANALYRKSYGPTKSAPELIDALYELLCWVLQNHPDKIKKL